jgi:hypothetical protein
MTEQGPALALVTDHATEDGGEGGANRENHHHLNQVCEETLDAQRAPVHSSSCGALLRLCEAICEFCSFCAK